MNANEIKKYYDDLYTTKAGSLESDTQSAIKQYTDNMAQLNKSIDDANRSLYTSYEKAQSNLPAQLARQGITGGASETANINLSSNYMNNLTSNEMARNNKTDEINNSIAALQESSRTALAELRAQNALEKYNAIKTAEQKEYEKQQAATEAAYKKQLQKAQALAEYGDFSGYNELGWNTSSMQNQWSKKAEEDEWAKELEWAVFMAEKLNDYDALYDLIGKKPSADSKDPASSSSSGKTKQTSGSRGLFPDDTDTNRLMTPPMTSSLWAEILKKLTE